MKAPVEGRALMVEKVEKHEWLEDLAEIGRAHQTCNKTVRPATGTLRDRPPQPRSGYSFPAFQPWVPLPTCETEFLIMMPPDTYFK